MIVDKINNLAMYKSVNPHIQTVIDFLANLDLTKLELGKNEIDGKNAWVLYEEYQPRALDQCYFERHQNYLDIQLVLKGREYLGYHNIEEGGVTIQDEYNAAKDVEKAQINEFTKVLLTDGMFALVLPQDWHMPKLETNEISQVTKLVFKLKV